MHAPSTGSRPSTDTAWGWARVLHPYRWAIVALLLCQLGQTSASLVLPTLSADVINHGIAAQAPAVVRRLGWWMALAALIQLGLNAAALWFGARIAMGVGRDLRNQLFEQVHRFAMHELQTLGVPSLITRCTNDVLQLQTMLMMVLTMIIIAPFMGIGGLIMAVHQDVHLSRTVMLAVPVLAVLVGGLMSQAVPLFQQMQTRLDRVNGILREQLTGLRVIRAFVRDRAEQQRFAQANDALTETSLRAGRLMALNMPAVTSVMHLTGVALIWVAADRIRDGQLQVGALVAFLSYLALILISVMMAAMLFVMAPRALISARRISEVMHTPVSIQSPQPALRLPAAPRLELAFHDVSFGYPGAQAMVLEHISFRVCAGETLGIIGATGSGKSTLLSLIPRFHDVTAGAITLNGVDVRSLDSAALYQLTGLVPQQAFLFSGTVADNLRYGRADATDEQLWQALSLAQARDFIEAIPEGLQAPVAQGGGNFSGGQRQRLTIARALVAQPAMLLFDDSFSALDAATDARLRAALRQQLGADTLTLIVGQRVASLRTCDRILVLDKGRVIGEGPHQHLLTHCPAYAEIVASQSGTGEAA